MSSAMIWGVLAGAVLGYEVATLMNGIPGDTFSEHVRDWAAEHWTRRVVLLAVMLWLAWHWGLL